MQRALRELVIVGIPSSQAFHLRVLDDPDFQRGEIDITYLERVGARLLSAELTPEVQRPLAVVAALLAEERRATASPPSPSTDPTATVTKSSGDRPSAWVAAARRDGLRG
jgi:acetyl-CoA carboxylase biotin carboxylase subunit